MNDNIFISLVDGRSYRDLIRNNLFKKLNNESLLPILLSEILNVDHLVNKIEDKDNVLLRYFRPQPHSIKKKYSAKIRRYLALNSPPLINSYLKFERKYLYNADNSLLDIFNEFEPSAVLSTHANLSLEMSIVLEAKRRKIPSVSMVRSWDNVYKGLGVRADYLTVWNEINKKEAIRLEGYDEENVFVTGAPQFDKYFQENTSISKNDFCKNIGFDPKKPIILLATRGAIQENYDETYLVDLLVKYIKKGKIDVDTQLILRLHPWSKLENFLKYSKYDNIHLSYYDDYIPTLGWSMTDEAVLEIKNMFKYSDILITPGSTMTLEAAIFNLPTLVPFFSTYQPTYVKNIFKTYTSEKHFKRIIDLKLVRVQWDEESFFRDLKNAYINTTWNEESRKSLLNDYIPFRDGRSVDRIVRVIKKVSSQRI